MDLFSIVAKLLIDTGEYEEKIAEARGSAEKMATGIKNAIEVSKAAFNTMTNVVGSVVDTITRSTGAVAAYGDNIDKMSQKLGISAEAYQEWEAVLQHSGTSIDSLGVGLKTLATKAADGSAAFTELGISQEKAAAMSREDLFAETITALQGVENENRRALLAQELFGRSAMELGPLLNTSAADTQAMRDRVHELGGVMSNDAVKAAAQYQDSLQDMTTAIDGAKRGLFTALLPAVTAVMDAISNIVPVVASLIDNFDTLLPVVGAVTGAFVTYKAAVAIGSIIEAVTKATQGMSIAQAALNVVMNANPIMLVVTALGALVSAFTVAFTTNEEFREKVSAAWNNVKNTVASVASAIGKIVDTIKGWLSNLGGTFKDIISSAISWGRDLIANFLGGLKQKWQDVKNWFSGALQWIRDRIHFSEPDKGPLSDFHTYAPDMMKLFAEGIKGSKKLITDAVDNVFDIAPVISASVETPNLVQQKRAMLGTAANDNNAGPITVVLNLNGTEFAHATVPFIDREMTRKQRQEYTAKVVPIF